MFVLLINLGHGSAKLHPRAEKGETSFLLWRFQEQKNLCEMKKKYIER